MAVGHRLLARGVVGDGGNVALRGEVDVAARIGVIKAVNAASVVLEEVADGIVGIVDGFADRNGTLYEKLMQAKASKKRELRCIFMTDGIFMKFL